MTKLKKSNKEELVGYISFLRNKVDELQSYQLIAKRVQLMEKTIVNSLQYQRRESVEFYGLPDSITDDKLEENCLNILEEIGCGKIQSSDVQACHRLKNRRKTIIRFVNRKNANSALHNRSKLKGLKKEKYNIPKQTNIYINESLCRPLQYLSFKIREAHKGKKIESYNIWKGKLSVKMNGIDYPISHIQDLIDIGLAKEEDKLEFLS